MVWMAAVEPISSTEHHIPLHDVGEVDVGKADGSAEAEHLSTTSPVAQSDGQSVWILSAKTVDIHCIFLHIRTQPLTISLIHERNGVESRLDGGVHIAVEGGPNLGVEVVEVLLFTSGRIELQVRAQVTPSTTASLSSTTVVLHQFRRLCHQSLRLREGTGGKVIVVTLQGTTGSSKHGGCLEVKTRIASGECPHIVRRSTRFSIG